MSSTLPTREGIKVIHFMCKILILVLIIAILLVAAKSTQITNLQDVLHLFTEELPQNCSNKIFCGVNGSTEWPNHQVNDFCYPSLMKEYQLVFIINVALIVIIGGLGNILTLVAVPYAYIRCPDQFSLRWGTVTFLIVHLSFCDLAYILVGLLWVLNIYINKGFTLDPSYCWFSSTFRNLICYADFLTLAFIALIKMASLRNLIKGNINREDKNNGLNAPTCAAICCIAIWTLSFLLISPIVFEVKIEGVNFGKYAYNCMLASCNTITCPTAGVNGPALIYTIGFFVPFFIVMISYMIIIPYCLKVYTSIYSDVVLENKEQYMDVCLVNRALCLLAFSYTVFTAPLVAIEWLDSSSEDQHVKATRNIIGYNWYWWIFAINFLVYMSSLEEFRMMYKLFLTDAVSVLCMTTSDISHLTFKESKLQGRKNSCKRSFGTSSLTTTEDRLFTRSWSAPPAERKKIKAHNFNRSREAEVAPQKSFELRHRRKSVTLSNVSSLGREDCNVRGRNHQTTAFDNLAFLTDKTD